MNAKRTDACACILLSLEETTHFLATYVSYHADLIDLGDYHTVTFIRNSISLSAKLPRFTARKYNCPVKQSRHPKVCKWIQDAVTAVAAALGSVPKASRDHALSRVTSES